MKKQSKKNMKKNANYNGRNIFGERCIEKTIKLEPGIAYRQAVEMIDDVMTSKVRIEYTIIWAELSPDEATAVQEKMTRYWNLRQMYA